MMQTFFTAAPLGISSFRARMLPKAIAMTPATAKRIPPNVS